MKKLFLLIELVAFFTIGSQAQYGPNYNILMLKGADSLTMAWAGGLNNPQFSEADLNNNGTNDLVVFERSGNKVYTFLYDEPNGFIYAPQYEVNFPALDSWCLLVDFNCDNVADIFARTTLGIKVYKGHYDDCNQLAFDLFKPLLYFDFNGSPQNLLVTLVDIPAIIDVNNDGDIDILTFDPNGGYMAFFENVSQESGWGCDSLYFERVDQCWGDFYEPTDSILYQMLDQVCPFMITEDIDPIYSRHTGSTTLAFDNTGDGIKELLLGDISFNTINYLLNDGTLEDAHIYAQDTLFPVYNIPVNVPLFPASYRFDVDHDGRKDLMFAPNSPDASNTLACAYFYKNSGTSNVGIFNFIDDTFLVRNMIDLGEGSAPAWFDYNNDGLVDLLIANESYYDTTSFVATFQNIGTATQPKFKLHKYNYANLSSLNQIALRPTFGDLDGDNDKDMICGNLEGTLLYFENQAALGDPAQFILTNSNYFNIDVGNYSAPQLYDINGDGLLDLLIGKLDGKLSYYENHGNAGSADFIALSNGNFGDINVNSSSLDGHSEPFMTNLPGYNEVVLLVGNKQGDLHLYDNIEGNLDGSFNLVTNTYSNIKTGRRSTVAGYDINNDGVVELAIGQYRGGMTIYDTASYDPTWWDPCVGINEIKNEKTSLVAYPNPANTIIYLRSGLPFTQNDLVETFDALGRKSLLTYKYVDERTIMIDVKDLPDGIYTTQIFTSQRTQTSCWLKMK